VTDQHEGRRAGMLLGEGGPIPEQLVAALRLDDPPDVEEERAIDAGRCAEPRGRSVRWDVDPDPDHIVGHALVPEPGVDHVALFGRVERERARRMEDRTVAREP